MIELGIVMGIVSVLLALVLGLARHVNAVVKIRRAQADLGEWHETFNRWHLQFGEYPYASINTETGEIIEKLVGSNNLLVNLTNLIERCEIQFPHRNNTVVTFRSLMVAGTSPLDPWGNPYLYDCTPDRQDYTLFSCGPDAQTQLAGGTELNNLDDIFFER